MGKIFYGVHCIGEALAMTTAVRVSLARVSILTFGMGFLLFSTSFCVFDEAGFRECFSSPVILLGSLVLGLFLVWIVARLWRPACLTLPGSIEESAPFIAAAAARMKYTVERLETGELVLRFTRSIAGAHPTIVVRPESASTLRIEGPSNPISRLSGFITGRRQSPDREPTLWDVFIALPLGLWILVDAGLLLFRVSDCASLEVPGSILYRSVGEGMRTLCERWGPFFPAAIEALVAAIPLAYAVFSWRQYRRRKQAPPYST
jgi:hypothetical protein